MPACPKPLRGDLLRAKHRAKHQDAYELSALYRQVYRRDNYACVACRRTVVVGSMDPFKKAHPHHIVFRSRADKAAVNTTHNVCTVCPFCHADIHDHKLYIRGNADGVLHIVRAR